MTEIIFNILLNLTDFIDNNYYYSFLLYFIISICFFTLSLPGSMIILISSGFLFGFLEGFIINIFSISLGSLIFIKFSKTILSKLFEKYYKMFSDKLSNYIKNSSFEYLILLRLVIGTPLIFQNICISLLNISKTKIFLSSFIGFTPPMLLLSYIGSHASNLMELKSFTFANIFTPEILFIIGCLIFLILLRIYFKK
tara:strand:- start:41 stop:631 length:591 start_codon:yes stop_codon:yes gene_type:complete